jgi:hypothetical protein
MDSTRMVGTGASSTKHWSICTRRAKEGGCLATPRGRLRTKLGPRGSTALAESIRSWLACPVFSDAADGARVDMPKKGWYEAGATRGTGADRGVWYRWMIGAGRELHQKKIETTAMLTLGDLSAGFRWLSCCRWSGCGLRRHGGRRRCDWESRHCT